tara:strand:- start:4985 stop:5497 length:513 start_codon:yes stop_codon:yes gene_type:complete
MTHVVIYGQTLSGKSTLAKRLATKYKKEGIGVLVFDPVNDPDWPCDFKTDNWEEFLNAYWNSEKCMVFIDEAGTVCKRFAQDAIKTATMGRHRGHINHYICQRANLLDLTIRDQASHLFLFNSGLKDCVMHSEEWNAQELKEGTGLKTGEYFYKSRMGNISRNYLFKNEE